MLFVGEAERVIEGALEAEAGEFLSRHVASAESKTGRNCEAPPCRPLASVMMKETVVPAAISTTQSKLAPWGGFRMNEVPPGMIPYVFGE